LPDEPSALSNVVAHGDQTTPVRTAAEPQLIAGFMIERDMEEPALTQGFTIDRDDMLDPHSVRPSAVPGSVMEQPLTDGLAIVEADPSDSTPEPAHVPNVTVASSPAPVLTAGFTIDREPAAVEPASDWALDPATAELELHDAALEWSSEVVAQHDPLVTATNAAGNADPMLERSAVLDAGNVLDASIDLAATEPDVDQVVDVAPEASASSELSASGADHEAIASDVQQNAIDDTPSAESHHDELAWATDLNAPQATAELGVQPESGEHRGTQHGPDDAPSADPAVVASDDVVPVMAEAEQPVDLLASVLHESVVPAEEHGDPALGTEPSDAVATTESLERTAHPPQAPASAVNAQSTGFVLAENDLAGPWPARATQAVPGSADADAPSAPQAIADTSAARDDATAEATSAETGTWLDEIDDDDSSPLPSDQERQRSATGFQLLGNDADAEHAPQSDHD
jgi:hypothetical protein